MKTLNLQSGSHFIRKAGLAVLAAGGLCLTTTTSSAQIDLGGAVESAISNQQGSVTGQVQGSVNQTPAQRGVNQAVQGVLDGQTPRDAVRGGINEAVRSSVETSQQTQLRMQQQQNQRDLTGQLNVQGNASNQVWQRDSQGRNFYLNSEGQAVYSQQGQHTDPNSQHRQNQLDARLNSSLGADFETRDQGIAVTSVQSGSFAANAGLQQGDVVLSIDGQRIDGRQSFETRVRDMQPNQQAQVMVLRNGQQHQLTVTGDANVRQRTHTRNTGNNEYDRDYRQLRQDVDDLRTEWKTFSTEWDSRSSIDSNRNNTELKANSDLKVNQSSKDKN